MHKSIPSLYFKATLFLLASILFSSCTENYKQADNKTAKHYSIVPPQVTLITNLPDSLQPKQTFLENVPIPFTVPNPDKAGGSYIIQTKSEPQIIKLMPAAVHSFIDSITQLPIAAEVQGAANFTTFNSDNGLALDVLFGSIKDKSGNLWFATQGGGVSKYDGKSFTTFTTSQGLVNNAVWGITEDKMGNLWFGTEGGVSKYDGKSFTTFTTAQGLAYNFVFCITEDKTGNIWFGTREGVSKYDVKRASSPCNLNTCKHDLNVQQQLEEHNKEIAKFFTSFSTAQGLTNNFVYNITEDKFGNIWFGTRGGGVSKYDGKSFTTFSTSQGLANNTVYRIKEDKTGNIWFGTGGGVSMYDAKRLGNPCNLNTCNHDLKVLQELEEHNKEITKSFTTFSTSQGLVNNIVLSITEDKAGNLWFGTIGGVSKYHVNRASSDCNLNTCKHHLQVRADLEEHTKEIAKSFTTYSTSQGLANNIVSSITEDNTGNLWFATQGGGVSKYDGKSFTNFSTKQGLAYNLVSCITEDKTGNIWFGTEFGATKYDGKSFTTYSSAQGLAYNFVYSIIEDKKGNIWFGTVGGVSKYDGKSFTTFTSNQGLADNRVYCIATDKTGNLWFGTYNGLSKYDGESFTTFSTSQGLANNRVSSITADKTGNIWCGTNDGVSMYDGKSFTTFTTNQGLAHNRVSSITEDKAGNLWLGTQGGGLSLISKEKLNRINELFKDNITHNRTSNGDEKKVLFENFTTAEGLPDNEVTQAVEGNDGKMYIGTIAGFCELIPSTLSAKGWVVEQTYNSATGYPVKDVNLGQNTMFKDSKGIIWIATGSDKTALVRFDPKAVQVNRIPPQLVIQNVKINNENICWLNLEYQHSEKKNNDSAIEINSSTSNDSSVSLMAQFNAFGKPVSQEILDEQRKKFGDIRFHGITKWYSLPLNLLLPYQHNNVTFDFFAIETSRNKLLRYQYILEGYDKEWSPVTDKTTATFGNIYEGNYTFKLKARSPEGVWGEPVSYTFKVLPPWWRTWWMYALYIVLAVSIIGGYIKWRERKLQKEKMILDHKITVATKVIREEKEKSDTLLLNILPSEVAEELKSTGATTAKDYSKVTVLFTDFKNFTMMSEQLTAQELVNEINYCYSAFDNIITKHGIEKIKTIGDSYMCAGGLPVANTTNAEETVSAALEIRDFMSAEKQKRQSQGKPFFEIRIGCNTGPVVAGIVGIKKYSYDIWGDTVNIASRIESSGEPGKVNISGSTFELVKDKFKCEHRGKIEAKNKGMIDMYFVS